MLFELSKWSVKPILMELEYRTNDKLDFIQNLCALINLIELTNDIEVNKDNMFEYIHIHELESNLTNMDLLKYIELDSIEFLDNL